MKGKIYMPKRSSDSQKKTLKKQLISGGVYVALSAVAVAVTVNTAVSMLSPKDGLENLENSLDNVKIDIPSIPEDFTLPEISAVLPETQPDTNFPVSLSPSGVDSSVINDEAIAENTALSGTENTDADSLNIEELSSNADLGEDVFVKPCDGFITVEHSVDIPVYSQTMGDYRTHCGVDIAVDKGALVKAAKGGIITKIYEDDLYGSCVRLETPDGFALVYSNLSQPLSEGIAEGIAVSVGTVIGGVGTGAIAESAQESHLHFELYKDGECVNPAEYIDF